MQAIGDIIKQIKPNPNLPPLPPSRLEFSRQPVYLKDLDTSHHPKVATAVKAARAWADRRREGYPEASLVLVGPNGIGKTHIAKSILWSIRYTENKRPVAPMGKFFVSDDLIQSFNVEPGAYGRTRASTIIGDVPILVIDDAGREQQIPYVSAGAQEGEKHTRFFRVIDYCYTFRISVIITANGALSDLCQVLGPRAWDRLQEMAPVGFMLDLAGVDSWRVKEGGRS